MRLLQTTLIAAIFTCVGCAAPSSDDELLNEEDGLTQVDTFQADSDAKVERDHPGSNYGKDNLASDNLPVRETFLRFNVAGTVTPVTKAKLYLWVYQGSVNGPAVYASSNSWSEASITWSNRPSRTSAILDNAAAVGAGTWMGFDVTPAVKGNGTFSFTLASGSNDGTFMYSREWSDASKRPRLVVHTDLLVTTVDAGTPGTIGPKGGTVDLLHLGLTGDTRPPGCNQTGSYPRGVINGIADQLKAKQAQFALDLGDHMFVCEGSTTAADAAVQANVQMGYYDSAMARFGGAWFMTLGNHECMSGNCQPGVSTEPNFKRFLTSLAPVSPTPWYSYDIHTRLGIARFVMVADNAWGPAQQTWLEATLADADLHAKYTIVSKHHPSFSAGSWSTPINATLHRHKLSLLLVGHVHNYFHPTSLKSSFAPREAQVGTGGAPLSGTFYGYALIDQLATGELQFTVYDSATGAAQDSWRVGPNP